jgi:TolB-like protein
MGILNDMKERRLVQIVLAYLAAGWVAVQVVDSLVDNDLLPGLAYTLVLIWYLTGMPLAVLIGWYHGEKGYQKAPKWEVAAVLIVIVSLSGFSAVQVQQHLSEKQAVASAAEGRLDPRRVAVGYFRDDSRDEGLRHVADALTEELIEALATVRTLDVVSRNGVLPFRDNAVAPDSMAALLEAGTIVAGSVRPEADGVRIDVRLIDGASGAEYRRTSRVHQRDDLLAASPAVAEEVARFLRTRLGEEITIRESQHATTSVNAWALLQQARRIRKDVTSASNGDPDVDEYDRSRLMDEADSLLIVAARLDRDWPAPVRERADLAYARSRLAHDAGERVAWALRAIDFASRALAVAPDDAKTLAIRGTARYWRWLSDPDLTTSSRADLLATARADLERAVARDPSRADAYSTLSHLYYNDPENGASAVALAAQRAYEEDAYLEVADDVLWRLHSAALDMGDFRRAGQACDEGRHRFPENRRFTQCQLLLMATPAAQADVDHGWRLLARADSLAPPHAQAYDRIQNLLYLGGVIARAGMPDSARAVLDRAHARIDEHVDARGDLLLAEAAFRAQLDDTRRAVELIEQYLARNPGHAFSPATGLAWWWKSLENDPAFQRLVRLRASDAAQ